MADDYQMIEVPAGVDPNQFVKGMGGGSSMVPPSSITQKEKADLLEKIDPTKVVEEIRHKFLGEALINGKWVKVQALQGRALSEKGAWDLSNLMLSVSSQNVSISKLNDREIRDRTLNIVKTAQYMCNQNWEEYGLKGTDQFHFIHQIIISNTFITLKQPEGEGIRKMIIGTLTESRVQQSSPQNQRGGLLNLFRRR